MKRVVIPPKILQLNNTNLPGKLFLAICAANPEVRMGDVCRTLSMTRPGLDQLVERLTQKQLVTQVGARLVIQVPGLVYVEHADGGHFVSSSDGSENGQKVAHPVSEIERMSSPAPLVILPELLEFSYLLASEKVLLAFYAANAQATNELVVETLGISPAGLKKLKRGLLEKRVLVHTGDRYTIRLPGLVFVTDSEGGYFLPESEARKLGYEITTPSPRLVPANDIYEKWQTYVDYLCRSGGATLSGLQEFTARMIKRIETESPDDLEREVALQVMRHGQNAYFAMQFVQDTVPLPNVAKYLEVIMAAPPEKLAALRDKIQGMKLNGVEPRKMLGVFGTSIAQAPHPGTGTAQESEGAQHGKTIDLD